MYKKIPPKDEVRVATVERERLTDGQPMVLVQVPGTIRDVYQRGCVKCLSYLLVLLGAFSILMQIGSVIVASAVTRQTVPGFWCGPMFVVCGVIGLFSVARCSRDLVLSFLAFCVLILLFAVAQLGLAAWGITEEKPGDTLAMRHGMNGMLVALAALALLCALFGSFLACHATCKRATTMMEGQTAEDGQKAGPLDATVIDTHQIEQSIQY